MYIVRKIKYIIQERSLICLQAMIEDQTDLIMFIEYLRSIAEVHMISTSVEVPEEAESVLKNFREKFEVLRDKFTLSETLKIHVISSHYSYYFRQTKQTLRHTNGEFTESAHSTLRKSEETHGFKICKKIGTDHHMKQSLNSIVLFNSKRIGQSSPVRLKRNMQFSSPNSSPLK